MKKMVKAAALLAVLGVLASCRTSFWAITSGVDGLSRMPEAEEVFELEEGDLSDLY